MKGWLINPFSFLSALRVSVDVSIRLEKRLKWQYSSYVNGWVSFRGLLKGFVMLMLGFLFFFWSYQGR